MTQNNTPVVATQETQNSIIKTGKIMTANTNCNINNERGQKLKDVLEGIGERSRKNWKGIAVAYKNLGGEYEDFENHFLKMSLKRYERTAKKYWEQEAPNLGGKYEDFKNNFLKMKSRRFEIAAKKYWEQESPNRGLATLQYFQGGRCSGSH